MASYREWNRALVSYFTSGVPRGIKVYLSVDDDILERIGQGFNHTPKTGSWSGDFRVAVREEVIIERQVDLGNLQGRTPDGLPQGVAFLGATVLAAYQMAEEEQIDQNNYFRRLREVLGFSTSESGRPSGMERGSEESLWLEWKRWLMEKGFLSSAQRGDGSTTYISYPISQSILRRADKERLRQLFNDKQWRTQWDAQTLSIRVRQEAAKLTQHLKNLLTGARSGQRHEAIAEAIHELYEQWRDDGLITVGRRASPTSTPNLFAGLYRTEDPFLGQVEYYFYPKQPRGLQPGEVRVQGEGNVYTLLSERPGWFMPIGSVGITELEGGASYQIDSPDILNYLILPQRDFWILTPDPENPDSGVYASWGRPSLGEYFILLCKEELLPQLELLRNERLLEWSGELFYVFENSNWVELHQCMVISQAWSGVFIKNQELYEALKPSASLSISLSGGLRVPNMGAWLEEHGPQVTLFGFYPKADLQVTRLSDGHRLLDESPSTNIPLSIEWSNPGDYLVEAAYASEYTERLVKIVDWSQLSLEIPGHRESLLIGSSQICGSVIETVSELG